MEDVLLSVLEVLAQGDEDSGAYQAGRVFGLLLTLGIIAGLIWLVVWLVRRSSGDGGTTTPMRPPPGAAPPQAPAAPPPTRQPQSPPANWYPDPRGERRLRYWDGSRWTEHTAD